MSGRPARRASAAALLLLALVGVLGAVPAGGRHGETRQPVASDTVTTSIDDHGTAAVRASAPSRRLALPAAATTDAPEFTISQAHVERSTRTVVGAAGRQFDARVASRGPPRS